MLIGEFRHSLDAKKRLSIPSKFRKELGRKVIVTRGLDRCLFVYSESAWKNLTKKFTELSLGSDASRGFNRFMLSGAVDVEIDSVGRVLIPDYLKAFADLKADVVLAGVGNRVEIWGTKRWETYTRKIESDANHMASKLAEEGSL